MPPGAPRNDEIRQVAARGVSTQASPDLVYSSSCLLLGLHCMFVPPYLYCSWVDPPLDANAGAARAVEGEDAGAGAAGAVEVEDAGAGAAGAFEGAHACAAAAGALAGAYSGAAQSSRIKEVGLLVCVISGWRSSAGCFGRGALR